MTAIFNILKSTVDSLSVIFYHDWILSNYMQIFLFREKAEEIARIRGELAAKGKYV